jgi:hypothetical protein
VGGRIGWLVTPSLLTYFSAGYTQANFVMPRLSLIQSLADSRLNLPCHLAIAESQAEHKTGVCRTRADQ